LIPVHHWARNFTVEHEDIDFLTGLLLEHERPLRTEALARALIEERLAQEAAAVQEHFKDARFYNPAHSYESGQKVIFPEFDYAIANIVHVRPGNNPEYGEFNVIGVQFDDDNSQKVREFATDLATPHLLSEQDVETYASHLTAGELTADEILETVGDDIIYTLEKALTESSTLIQVAGEWFPSDLIVEVNEGHLNLAEAVIDINSRPLSTAEIIKEIGGLGSGSNDLQVFSLNNTLRDDDRFDEVGPSGQVLWYLLRLEPPEVRNTPAMLRYTAIDYDPALLTPEMLELEAEIDDELSSSPPLHEEIDIARITLTYPHRRTGTLPLNNKMRQVFPTAQQTSRISVTLVDGQDDEEFPGWVVRKERYVVGVDKFFRKHRLPIGAYVAISRSSDPGKIVVNFNAYKPRTEWIRLIVPKNNQITFENHKRSIGAEYDDLMILGADDLAGVDALFEMTQQQKRPLASLLRVIIPGLGRLTPQATVHAKTIYSAVNVIRRCPPGPIFATLVANPDFQNVGGHYWKLSDS
jgi:hypothetical protein